MPLSHNHDVSMFSEFDLTHNSEYILSVRPSVCCVIFRPGSSGADVLLHQRADNKLWGMPGGALEYGESIADAAKREVLEETGLTVDVLGIVGVHSDPATGAVFPYPDGNRVHYVCITVLCGNPQGTLRGSHESDALMWFPFEHCYPELIEPFADTHRDRIEAAWRALHDHSRLLPMH